MHSPDIEVSVVSSQQQMTEIEPLVRQTLADCPEYVISKSLDFAMPERWLFSVKENGNPIGWSSAGATYSATHTQPHLHLLAIVYFLFLLPPYHGQGIGRKMAHAMAKHCAESIPLESIADQILKIKDDDFIDLTTEVIADCVSVPGFRTSKIFAYQFREEVFQLDTRVDFLHHFELDQDSISMIEDTDEEFLEDSLFEELTDQAIEFQWT